MPDTPTITDIEQAVLDRPRLESGRFVRYENDLYRVISMISAMFVVVLVVTLLGVAPNLDPPLATSFLAGGTLIGVVAAVWYFLGLRCYLDISETWVRASSKYSTLTLDRERVVAIEPDRSLLGTFGMAGLPMILSYYPDMDDTSIVAQRRVPGCSSYSNISQESLIAELQGILGAPGDNEPTDEESIDVRLGNGQSRREKKIEAVAQAEKDRAEEVVRMQSSVLERLERVREEENGAGSVVDESTKSQDHPLSDDDV